MNVRKLSVELIENHSVLGCNSAEHMHTAKYAKNSSWN
jgi:hypothetical protein